MNNEVKDNLLNIKVAVAEYRIGTRRQIIALTAGGCCFINYIYIPRADGVINIKITNLWEEFCERAGLDPRGAYLVPRGPYYADYDKARGIISALKNEIEDLKGKKGIWANDLEEAVAVLNALDLEYLKLINE